MKSRILLLPLFIWLLIAAIEIVVSNTIAKNIVYWRAWEKISNYNGTDGSIVPFKPLSIYDGKSVGDLLNGLNLKPRQSEIRHQYVEIDEYGFRNRKGQLENKVEAVITGSSYVGGAQETQDNLVSEILTNGYGIRTYNYAIIPIQHFWEDKRFLINKPKYFILLGAEGEFISAHWKSEIVDNNSYVDIPKWKSTEEWMKSKEILKNDFISIQGRLVNFSLTRYFVNKLFVEIQNFHKTRLEVASKVLDSPVKYDASSDTLYYNPSYDNPILGKGENSIENIDEEIQTLKKSRDLLKKRGITLIVAAMPSKMSLQSPLFRGINREKFALTFFEKELDKNDIDHIKLFDLTRNFVNRSNEFLYYKDDSHWNTEANRMIAKLIYLKIKELNENKMN